MPSAERIAELQRVVYGRGASDDERRDAAAELAALRQERMTVPTEAASDDRPPALRGDGATTGDVDPGHADADPLGLGVPDTDSANARSGATAAMRLAVLVGAIALAIGFGAGWMSGSVTTAELIAERGGSAGDPADDLAFPLAAETATGPEAPAMAVFEREQTESDRTPMAGGDDPMFDPLTQRRLVTLADGATFSAALDDAGGMCLAFDRSEGGGASTCTGETSFPPEGLHFDSTFESRVDYDLQWYASGEIRVLRTPAG